MWCPTCKNEYRAGITVCPECNIELQEELSETENYTEVCNIETELAKKVVAYLEHLKIDAETKETTVVVTNPFTGEEKEVPGLSVSVPKKKAKQARQEVITIIQVESQKKLEKMVEEDPSLLEKATTIDYSEDNSGNESEDDSEEEASNSNITRRPEFKKADDRRADYKSSGYMLIGFGIVLAVLFVLGYTEVFAYFSGTMSLIMLAVLTVALIVGGISSLISASKMSGDVVAEKELEEKFNSYLTETFTKENLDCIADEETPLELLYMKRVDYIKEEAVKAFPDMDPDQADELIEAFYNNLYQE